MENLNKLFNPKTIAVIGATQNKARVGYALMNNLIGSAYEGIVYPVNPKRKSVLGVKAYKSVSSIPDKIDLAIIATPAETVPEIIEQCGAAGVAGVIIISSGFTEAGRHGEAMGRQILKTAKKYNIRILGPNCLGFIRPKLGLNASFAGKITGPGHVAFISQSGALCTSALDWAIAKNINFSYFVSVGSMLDIGFHDLIDYFNQDPDTSSILIYMESLTDARKFLSAARAFSRHKPIVVLKVGKSREGARAAKSHTGSMTGNDDIYNAAFKRAGIVRARSISDLFDNAQTLATQPHPKSNRLAIVTNAGGPGVIATDSLISMGGRLAVLPQSSIDKLGKILPPAWSKGNPIDILGDAPAELYREAIKTCLDDDNVDAVLAILTPQSMTNPARVAAEIVALSEKKKKTVLASFMGAADVAEGRAILEKGGIPVFDAPENAVRSFMYMCNYARNRELLYETPGSTPHAFRPKTSANRELIDRVVSEDRLNLTEAESKELLSNYAIPVAKNAIATSAQEATRLAQKIGFPVVMKILSPDILHKTDIGGVEININNREQAKRTYEKLMRAAKKSAPQARVHGIFIEAMVKKRYELLVGCKKDPVFGPAIVFGMGGVAVEVFKDTNIGLPPLNMALAMRIIEGTKIYRLLKGYRGMPGVNIESIQFLLYKFAYLVSDFPEIKELDINPFAVDENGGVVLDAKVILDENAVGKKVEPYSHLVISPYPKEQNRRVKMNTGQTAVLRPIVPEDEEKEKALIETFSENTHRHRFFRVIKDIDHELLTGFTQIDYYREVAIVAELSEKKKEVFAGVVRMKINLTGDEADFTIAVGDPWQFKGLGKKMTDYIIEIATQKGVKNLRTRFLKDNEAMKNIVEKRGFEIFSDGKFLIAEKRTQKTLAESF